MNLLRSLVLAAARHAAGPANGTISLPHIRYLAILPEIVLLGGAVVLLAVGSLVRRPLRPIESTVATVVISATALGLALWQWADVASHGAYTAIDKAVVVDGFSVLITITTSVAMILTALASEGYLRREGVSGPEYHVLAMVSASGAMLMGEANDLLIVFLGLEILSIALYVLAAFNPRRAQSGEAALKYFILGGFSSAIFVYGIALVYGATGSTNLLQIADFLSKNVVVSDGLLLAGLALLLVGFAFKVAAVPFHMWAPDVYQGSPSPIVGFMAAVAKVGAFAALLRVFISTFGVLHTDWQPIVYALAALTLVVGAVVALVQRDIKRMLAYSSINHAGFVLLGLQAATAAGVAASLYYLFAYTVMVVGTFAIVSVLGGTGDGRHDIAGYRGLSQRQPLLALCLAVLLLAQAGAPFTTGFLAKFQVVAAAVDTHSVPLAAIAMVTAAIAAFFYLRVAVVMYSPWRSEAAATDDESAPLTAPVSSDDPDAPPVTAPVAMWAGAERSAALTTRINATLLLEVDTDPDARWAAEGDEPQELPEAGAGPGTEPDTENAPEPDVEPVPVLSVVAIGICVAVTLVFGIIPAPLIDFAHQAKLLFGG